MAEPDDHPEGHSHRHFRPEPPRHAHDAPASVDHAFRIAAVPGVTLTKWTRAWAERHPHLPLEVVRSTEPSQLWAVREGEAEVAFVRSQGPDAELSMITLYDEAPVVVVPSEHPFSELAEVTLADLADENQLSGDVADAVELVAANIGVIVAPQSIARLHARKDVTAVPVSDAAVTPISIAWIAGSADARIEEFVGIVRGRTARSSRANAQSADEPTKKSKKSKAPKNSSQQAKAARDKPKPRKQTASEARAAANRRKRQAR